MKTKNHIFVSVEFKRADPNPPENAVKFRMSDRENYIFCGKFNHGQVLLNKFRSALFRRHIINKGEKGG